MFQIKGAAYQGEITPPSSKSDTHRALICASLSSSKSHVTNISFSDDINATMESMHALGAGFEVDGNNIITSPIFKTDEEVTLNVNESGSTLRFLIPVSLVFSHKVHFVMKGNLINRPIDSYINTFKNQDISITKEENGYYIQGHLKSGIFEIDGNVSSQFISGLLFALPLLDGDSKIIIKNKISSLNYILMTIDSLKKFGINVDFNIEEKVIIVPGNQEYKGTSYQVENDFSQASFFLALGLINHPLVIKGMNLSSYQPDKNIIKILQSLKANMIVKDDEIEVYPSKLEGTTISLDENPDLGPILFGLATFASSPVTFTNIKRLRIKESDRIEAMRYNLSLLGGRLELIDEDTLIVYPSKLKEPTSTLSSFHDHRIFMTLCVITSNLNEVSIDENKCINKSYPNFLLDLDSLRSN